MKNIKYGLLCFVPTVILLLFWDSLPDRIATHFNFFGNADVFSSKWHITLLIPILGFLGHSVYMVILDQKSDWIGRKGFKKYSLLYFPILTCAVIMFFLWNS